MAAQRKEKQESVREPVERPDPLDNEAEEEVRESLHAMAARLHPGVDWERMSPESVRSALGLAPEGCREGQEYLCGRLARGAGDPLPQVGSLAFRLGWRHGQPAKSRRRRWRARPVATTVKGGSA
ncbi:hypothetical protein [Aquibaculum sediminis]|uniref:hypothetical protein n=1 Tax=Aquibaculum sediminis TaxID=3231907 RepID=UPI003453391D